MVTRKDLQAIAEAIEAHAVTLPDTCAEDAPKAIIQCGTLTLRCMPTKQAALDMAARYRKARVPKNWRTWNPPTLPSLKAAPFSQTTLDAFIDDGELDNAEQYAELHGRTVYYIATNDGRTLALQKAEPLKSDPRFVVGTKPGPYSGPRRVWTVTHIASGFSATMQAHPARDSALAEFRAIDPSKLEAAIAKAQPLHAASAAA